MRKAAENIGEKGSYFTMRLLRKQERAASDHRCGAGFPKRRERIHILQPGQKPK